MTIIELRDRLISDGIAEVKRVYPLDSYKQRGALAGFELCRTLETRKQFEIVLQERSGHEFELKCHFNSPTSSHAVATAKVATQHLDEYWEYRWATLQVDYVYKALLVMWGAPELSARVFP
jgi:hypothetical protein